MSDSILRPHGGYEGLYAFQLAEIVYDGTVIFCDRFINPRSRTHDQMVQAARSGRQNIAEGSIVAATSSKLELNLISVARGSLGELRLDYEDYLRQNRFELWSKDSAKASFIRRLAKKEGRSFETYRAYVADKSAETAANTMLCVIHQASFLLDGLKRQLEKEFLEDGGMSERMYKHRKLHQGSSQTERP